MPTTFKHARILAVPIAGFALVMAGLSAAPAQAAEGVPTTTVHIENVSGQPVSGLTVDAEQGEFTPENFYETETPGDYEATGLYPGEWTLYAYDDSNVPQPYVDADADFTVDEEGAGQALPTITMDLGAIVSGKVTAPSGHALKNVLVTAARSGSPYADYMAVTNTGGNFSITRIAADTYTFGYIASFFNNNEHAIATPARTLTVGQISTGLNVTKVKVPASMSVKGKAAKRKATLTVKANGKDFGITNPGGTVTVKEGRKTLKKNVRVKSGAVSINLTKLKKGKHTFTVSYVGGDLLNATRKITVKVK